MLSVASGWLLIGYVWGESCEQMNKEPPTFGAWLFLLFLWPLAVLNVIYCIYKRSE